MDKRNTTINLSPLFGLAAIVFRSSETGWRTPYWLGPGLIFRLSSFCNSLANFYTSNNNFGELMKKEFKFQAGERVGFLNDNEIPRRFGSIVAEWQPGTYVVRTDGAKMPELWSNKELDLEVNLKERANALEVEFKKVQEKLSAATQLLREAGASIFANNFNKNNEMRDNIKYLKAALDDWDILGPELEDDNWESSSKGCY